MTLRRTALKTGGPLRRFTELRRRSRVESGTSGEGGSAASKPVRGLRASRHRMPTDVAAIVRERSAGRCEAAVENCWGTAREMHHRITRKSGGRHREARKRSDRPSGLLHLCSRCHLVITDHPKWAYSLGLSLREGQDPAREPVLYRGELSYLDDDGNVWSNEEVGA